MRNGLMSVAMFAGLVSIVPAALGQAPSSPDAAEQLAALVSAAAAQDVVDGVPTDPPPNAAGPGALLSAVRASHDPGPTSS